MLYALEAVSLSSANCRVLENCINRALYNLFGPCDDLHLLSTCIAWIGLCESQRQRLHVALANFEGNFRYAEYENLSG